MGKEKKSQKGARIKKIGGDQNIMSGKVSGGISIQGRDARVKINQPSGLDASELTTLFETLYRHIESRPPDPNLDKDEIVETVQKIQEEASKGEDQVNEAKLTRWVDNLNKMAPDIVDVALASLGGPVSGVTALLKKIADRARQQPAS